MANLGSEMLRAFSFNEKGDKAMTEASIARCLKIIDILTADSADSPGKREALILKDILESILQNKKKYSISKKDLEIYFNPFALRFMTGAQ